MFRECLLYFAMYPDDMPERMMASWTADDVPALGRRCAAQTCQQSISQVFGGFLDSLTEV